MLHQLGTACTYLANELHVTVLNTVVYHLDVVSSTLISHPLATWVAMVTLALGSDALENILDVWPGLLISTGHQGRSVSRTLLASGYTRTDESDPLARQVLCSAVGVREMGITTIDDDVALLEQGQEGLDEIVNRLAGHDQEHDTARCLELGDELLEGVGTFNRLS